MNNQDKMTVHFLVSKLVIFAVPLLNNALEVVGIHVTTSSDTVDALTNDLCIALGLAYSWWAHQRTKEVHADLGFHEGVEKGFRNGVTATLRGAADTVGKLGSAEASEAVSHPTSSSEPMSAEPVAQRATATAEPDGHPSLSSTTQTINNPIPPL